MNLRTEKALKRVEEVTFPFRKPHHPCRFEKDGYCKKIKGKCAPQKCPQIPKEE